MPLNKKRILLADDDLEDQDMLVDALQRVDVSLHIDTVSNGKQVLDYLSSCQKDDLPCLIILDYKMPILNAAEVLEKMMEEQQYVVIPKIVWSTSRQEEHMTRCLKAGASQYFIKPNDVAELKSIAAGMVEACS